MPTLGLQATSRTQSLCACPKWCCSIHSSDCSSCRQIRTWLSHPPVTMRRGPSVAPWTAGPDA